MDIGWSDFKKLLSDVIKLTSNVTTLQTQLEAAADKISQQEKEISEIKSDLRVARAELEGQAIKAAANTVIQAHEQMLSRLIDVENTLALIPPTKPLKALESEKERT